MSLPGKTNSLAGEKTALQDSKHMDYE